MDCPTGEFWIDDSGYSYFAGDLGDESHESLAYRNMIDFWSLSEEMVNMGYRNEGYSEEDAESDYFNGQIDNGVLETVIGKKKLRDINDDVKWAYIKHEDAIRVVGGSFGVRKINKDTINRIKDFLDEQYNGTEIDPECSIDIEEVLVYFPKPGSPQITRKFAEISFKDLMEFVETTSELVKVGMVRNV